MHVIEVMPITRSPGIETLSYFSSKALPEGSFIYVTVRKSQVPAIVISSKPAEEQKSQLKSLPYALKKLDSEDGHVLFSDAFISSARKTADYFASTTGAVIDALSPGKILQSLEDLTPLTTPDACADTRNAVHAPETYVLQSDDDERYAYFKSLIRESFAKKKSVFLCVPTIEDAATIAAILEKGIEEYSIVLHGSMTKKATVHAWEKALHTDHPVLIIATGSFLCIPRHDIGAIIIEKESSRSYKGIKRPYIDVRTFAEYYATKMGARLIYADQMLRIETAWRFREGDFIEASPAKWRSLSTAQCDLVDMKQYKAPDKTGELKPEFRVLSDETIELIEKTKRDSERMYIYVGRRGLSPSVVCNDCGTIVRCTKCHAPVVLHGAVPEKSRGDEGNFFLCHRCGERRSALETCMQCQSWNLTTLGIGAERVEKELKTRFPDVTFFKIDFDSAKTHAKAQALADTFYATPGAVMIGTEMALQYLREKIENAAVISMDTMFSLPDFRINEKILGTILKIRSLAYKHLVVQTRQADQKIWDHALKGNLIDFYRDEIGSRERFGYPPFTTLIKITYEGKREAVMEAMKQLKEHLKPWKVAIFPAFIETSDRTYILHGLIKLAKTDWIERDLLRKLRSLPPTYSIKIDPENLL